MQKEGHTEWGQGGGGGRKDRTDSQHTICPVLNDVLGFSALEQGSVYKTWEWDHCLTSSKRKTRTPANPPPQTGFS